jgi:hypothetical protein
VYIDSPFKPTKEIFAYLIQDGIPIIATRLLRENKTRLYETTELIKSPATKEGRLTEEFYRDIAININHGYLISDNEQTAVSISVWKRFLISGYAKAFDVKTKTEVIDIDKIWCKSCANVILIYSYNKTFNLIESNDLLLVSELSSLISLEYNKLVNAGIVSSMITTEVNKLKTFKEFINESYIAKLIDSIAKEMDVDRSAIGDVNDVGTLVKFEITSGPSKGKYFAETNSAVTMIKKNTIERI